MKKIVFNIFFMFALFFSCLVLVSAKEIIVEDFSLKDKSTTAEVDSISFTNNTISSNIKLNQVDDFVEFYLVIKNNENVRYKIDSVTDNNTNTNIELSYDYPTTYVDSGNLITIVIKMLYKNQLINVEKQSLDNLSIDIKLVDEQKNDSHITINPQTSDNIIIYISITVISLIGLILLIKNYKKFGVPLFVIYLVILPIALKALEVVNIEISFVNVDIIGEFETYELTIDEDNGNSYTVNITYGQKVGELDEPQKDGYSFVKWEDDDGNTIDEDTVITGPININAVYSINTYSITYNLGNGTANNVTTYTIEDEVTLTNPTKNYYIFIGWTGSNGNTPQKDLVIPVGSFGDKTYTANYDAYSYTISFDSNGGTGVMDDEIVDYDEEFTLPNIAFTKENYKFVGWTDSDDNAYDNQETVVNLVEENNGTIVLYANWELLNKITVSKGYGIDEITYKGQTVSDDLILYLDENENIDLDDLDVTYIDSEFAGKTMFIKSGAGSINNDVFTAGDGITTLVVDPTVPYKCYCNNYTNQHGVSCTFNNFTYSYKQQSTLFNGELTWQDISSGDGYGIRYNNLTSTDPIVAKTCAYVNDKPIISMQYSFYQVQASSIDVSQIYTKNMTGFGNSFRGMAASEFIGADKWDVSNALNLAFMFMGATNITTLDITGWNPIKVTNLNNTFRGCSKLKTIYVSPDFSLPSINQGIQTFIGSTLLRGGAGTAYSSSNVSYTYARIDDPDNGKPGYFTSKE